MSARLTTARRIWLAATIAAMLEILVAGGIPAPIVAPAAEAVTDALHPDTTTPAAPADQVQGSAAL